MCKIVVDDVTFLLEPLVEECLETGTGNIVLKVVKFVLKVAIVVLFAGKTFVDLLMKAVVFLIEAIFWGNLDGFVSETRLVILFIEDVAFAVASGSDLVV